MLLATAYVSIIALLGVSIIGEGVIIEEPFSASTLPAMAGALLVLSLILSSVAGMLQSAAAIIAVDIVRPFRRSATDLSLVLVGRLATTGMAVVVLLFLSALGPLAPAEMVQFMNVHIAVAPSLAALIVGVLFVRRMTARAAVVSMLAGAGLGLAYIGLPGGLSPAVFALVSFAVSLAALIGVSYLQVGQARQDERAPAEIHPGGADVTVLR
jgi:Na+/proline symporter